MESITVGVPGHRADGGEAAAARPTNPGPLDHVPIVGPYKVAKKFVALSEDMIYRLASIYPDFPQPVKIGYRCNLLPIRGIAEWLLNPPSEALGKASIRGLQAAQQQAAGIKRGGRFTDDGIQRIRAAQDKRWAKHNAAKAKAELEAGRKAAEIEAATVAPVATAPAKPTDATRAPATPLSVVPARTSRSVAPEMPAVPRAAFDAARDGKVDAVALAERLAAADPAMRRAILALLGEPQASEIGG